MNLIPRLYDVSGGSVSIADIDVRDFDLAYLRQQIGVVTQEAYLFNGTILENLRYANEDATLEQIEEACRIANIHDYIAAQPLGYDTEVGNRGLKLSGGEKQRLSLARVILKDPITRFSQRCAGEQISLASGASLVFCIYPAMR